MIVLGARCSILSVINIRIVCFARRLEIQSSENAKFSGWLIGRCGERRSLTMMVGNGRVRVSRRTWFEMDTMRFAKECEQTTTRAPRNDEADVNGFHVSLQRIPTIIQLQVFDPPHRNNASARLRWLSSSGKIERPVAMFALSISAYYELLIKRMKKNGRPSTGNGH